ncbi:MAG: DNA-binding protein [Candidatus Bathyarchaeota archaeon]|nr:DNA-binding protein [Candidatus Bathyarchaeota archaeon]MDH5788191.1 DNA-binding protein [Candidatus Bathyarchaeota archaeon]
MTAEPKNAKKKLRIILDSNALYASLQFKIDIWEELKTLLKANFETIILLQVLQELEKLAEKGSPKMRKEAKYVLKLAEKCRVVNVSEEYANTPDEAIVNAAHEWRCPVFTNDRELRKRLRDINVPVIYVREKSHLEIDGRIRSPV